MLDKLLIVSLLIMGPGDSLNRPVGGPFTSVTENYGPLIVHGGRFSAESAIKPWSSWWFPLNEDYLFQQKNGAASPLERYDALVGKTTGRNPQSAAFEREHLFQPHSVAWAGLCDAWAIASLTEPEPVRPVQIRGVEFRIGDLKALLLKSYEAVDGLQIYGQRFDGKWDSVYEDIYPDQFHRFMQVELFQNKNPFIIDHDAGIEVWNTPTWKAQTLLTPDAQNKNVMHVKTWLYTASPHVKTFDYVGTEQVIREYTYDLIGHFQSDGNFIVSAGVWTDRSRWDHPDYVIPKPRKVIRKTWNGRLDISTIDMILKQ